MNEGIMIIVLGVIFWLVDENFLNFATEWSWLLRAVLYFGMAGLLLEGFGKGGAHGKIGGSSGNISNSRDAEMQMWKFGNP